MKILILLVSWRKLLLAENKEMPTGTVSGCRQICLAVVGVRNKARLLTHLHMSLACLQLPKTLCTFVDFYFFFCLFLVACKYKLKHTLLTTICTGCVGTAHLKRASYLQWRLYFERLGTGQERLTWQSHPPLAQSGSDVSVSDESQWYSRGIPWPLSEIIHYFVAQRQACI